jgi:putative component of membrane protein insertase Oxa1/YidC/SpoIIIJ protein YidD
VFFNVQFLNLTCVDCWFVLIKYFNGPTILFVVLRCLQGWLSPLTLWQCSPFGDGMWSLIIGRLHFPQALADGRDETLLSTNETGKEIVSVKTFATQNFVLHFTFSSCRHTFSCSSPKHIDRLEFFFKGSKNGTKINSNHPFFYINKLSCYS